MNKRRREARKARERTRQAEPPEPPEPRNTAVLVGAGVYVICEASRASAVRPLRKATCGHLALPETSGPCPMCVTSASAPSKS
jgi:hypothetical protein